MMSTNMTYQDAYDNLINKVYAPVFFNKLASTYGLQPANDQEAEQMAALAVKLRQAEANEGTKIASARGNLLSEAHKDLDKVLGKTATDHRLETEIHKAATKAAGDQSLKDYALVYRDFLAQVSTAK